MNSRILVLDSFRGLAAVSVMLFHFTFLYNSIYNNLSIDFTFKYGFYGVQLFFMISGFVIFMSLNKVTSIKDFFYKRFIRLYPTYWICLIMTTLFIVLFPLHLYSVTLKQFLGNLTMVQGLLKIDNIDGSYWSLLPELMFYLMMTIIIKFKLHNKIIIFSSFWLALMFFSIIKPSLLDVLLNLRFGSFFIAGIMFYRIYNKLSSYKEHLIILLTQLFVFLIFNQLELSFVFLLFTILFYLFVYHKLDFFHNKILSYLGAISYPLYLIHQTVGITILNYMLTIGINSYLSLFFVIVLVFLLAIIIYEFFEKPILKLILKK